MPLTRRTLLGSGAAGLGMLAVPRILIGCSKAAPLAAPVPSNPFQDWFGIDEAVIRRVLAELASRGADAADVYLQYRRRSSISLEDGVIGRASAGVDLGVGLRVVVGDTVGYAFTEDLTEASMLGAARTAASIASGSPRAAPEAFQYGAVGEHYRISVPWADIGVADKLPLVERTEALVRAAEPSIDKVSVSWSDAEERVLIATLDGRVVIDERPSTRLWVDATARRGEQSESGSSNVAGRHGFDWYDDARLKQVADEAVERTMVRFDAVRPPAGELPVVLDAGASGILLHEAIGHGMEADFNRKGVSIYADMLGKQVAPDFVTIVDDGTVPNERGALNVDDEGHPCERTVLVEQGRLAGYLHDGISAEHFGVPRTGSGRRQSYRYPPMPRMRCTYMEDGPHTRDEIIASVDKGIVASTFGNGQVQIGAGDFTFYIRTGWLIEGGRITAPIKDVNIIGNGPDALRAVTMAADDGQLDTGGWTCGKDGQRVPVSQGLPTVLVSSLTVGGTHAG